MQTPIKQCEGTHSHFSVVAAIVFRQKRRLPIEVSYPLERQPALGYVCFFFAGSNTNAMLDYRY